LTRPVVVIGANGQLGSDLCSTFDPGSAPLVALTHEDIELRDHAKVAAVLESLEPKVIVNTAAFHQVEACETEVDQAFAVNCIAVRNLALAADRLGARLVHFSTDYVFDGEAGHPYAETATPNPVNAYGASKAAGEFFVRALCRDQLIIRTSGLYGLAGSSGKGGNFVQTMLRLGRERGEVSVVTDQVLSPTFTLDLAQKAWQLVASDVRGTVHVTNAGWCSWYEFAKAIFEFSDMDVLVRPIDTVSSGSPVRRPPFSALANARLETEGLGTLRSWREALAGYLHAAAQPVAVGLLHGDD
jgi:dTDP-4-dehydrorhamnose reductase